MRATVKVTEQGKITIPKPVREAMGIDGGDTVELEVHRVVEVANEHD